MKMTILDCLAIMVHENLPLSFGLFKGYTNIQWKISHWLTTWIAPLDCTFKCIPLVSLLNRAWASNVVKLMPMLEIMQPPDLAVRFEFERCGYVILAARNKFRQKVFGGVRLVIPLLFYKAGLIAGNE